MSESRKPKKAAPEDWHRADIVAALRKAGWSLRQLALHHGYSSPTTLTAALDRRWPKGQALIADAIGIEPAKIWPSRYAKNASRTASKNNTNSGVQAATNCKAQRAAA
ncbi:helix-turn-helix domain-containing protein [Marinobacter subterrani]|uniref:Transcriptional regulator, Nlp family n=1 Tax=Marinobacter subterrani TaxID=1658765 RepID=A0A0J7J7B0_9GAMM|nr:helix-turn-helix domain-containing protein [Marinobacter subterrani]KMQ74037.1 transcriptional regulator, Nlp family [Marinobacter subterrani]